MSEKTVKSEVIQPDKSSREAFQANGNIARTVKNMPLLGLIAGVIVFFSVVGLVAMCYAVFQRIDNRHNVTTWSNGKHTAQRESSMGRGDRLETSDRHDGVRGVELRTSSSTVVRGVVTAVDGNTITVAGNGVTTNVIVSDSTTYIGSAKSATTNDTIIVFGTKNPDGSFMANSVRLLRQ